MASSSIYAVSGGERNESRKTSVSFHRRRSWSPKRTVSIGGVIDITAIGTIIIENVVQHPMFSLKQSPNGHISKRRQTGVLATHVKTSTWSCSCIQPRNFDTSPRRKLVTSLRKYGAIPTCLFLLPECINCFDHAPMIMPHMAAQRMWLNSEDVLDLILKSYDPLYLLCLSRS